MQAIYFAVLVAPLLLVSAWQHSLHSFHPPLENTLHRATPLSFGLSVTPDPSQNPITPPERFYGIHAATDYEVSTGELHGDVPVYAICTGEVVYSDFAEGYGGLLVHRCTVKNQPLTVIYGHLQLEGLPPVGSTVTKGDVIGLLADAQSEDSDGNRKHLHLGIHKGEDVDIRGYVQDEKDLEGYIDPQTIFKPALIDLPGESPGEIPYWEETSDPDA